MGVYGDNQLSCTVNRVFGTEHGHVCEVGKLIHSLLWRLAEQDGRILLATKPFNAPYSKLFAGPRAVPLVIQSNREKLNKNRFRNCPRTWQYTSRC
mgnify:CR=1 FL=1